MEDIEGAVEGRGKTLTRNIVRTEQEHEEQKKIPCESKRLETDYSVHAIIIMNF